VSQAKNGAEIPVPRGKPGRSILWDEIKDEISPEMFVTLQFLVELFFRSVRDEIRSQPFVTKAKIGNYRLDGMEENRESG
jgi:hypothetical protein